jgi:hypothetical protein
MKELSVVSRSGKTYTLKYPGIASAQVTDAHGKAVNAQVSGDDTLTFETQVGGHYFLQL